MRKIRRVMAVLAAPLLGAMVMSVGPSAMAAPSNPPGHAQDFDAVGTSEIENLHTHFCLWQSVNSIQQRNSCDPNNVHDLWLLL